MLSERRGVEVLDPQIKMDLLRWYAVGPVGRDVVRCVLHTGAALAQIRETIAVLLDIP